MKLPRKIVGTVTKISVSIFFLFLAFYKVEWQEISENLQKISFFYIGITFIAFACGFAISVKKWKILADSQKLKISYGQMFAIQLTSIFINNFTPSFVGGDAYRIYQTGKPEGKYGLAASIVVLDRIVGLMAAMSLGVFFALLSPAFILNNNILFLSVVSLALLFLTALLFIINARTLLRLIGVYDTARKYLPEKLKSVRALM